MNDALSAISAAPKLSLESRQSFGPLTLVDLGLLYDLFRQGIRSDDFRQSCCFEILLAGLFVRVVFGPVLLHGLETVRFATTLIHPQHLEKFRHLFPHLEQM